jgi:hypothetical protein
MADRRLRLGKRAQESPLRRAEPLPRAAAEGVTARQVDLQTEEIEKIQTLFISIKGASEGSKIGTGDRPMTTVQEPHLVALLRPGWDTQGRSLNRFDCLLTADFSCTGRVESPRRDATLMLPGRRFLFLLLRMFSSHVCSDRNFRRPVSCSFGTRCPCPVSLRPKQSPPSPMPMPA